VKQLANEDPGIRVSARGSQLFVPDEILLKFQTYVKKKVHFTADQSLASTPSLKRQQPFQQRPSSADTTKDKESKKGRPESPPPLFQSNVELKCELKCKIKNEVIQLQAVENKIAKKVKQLKALERDVKNANRIEASIRGKITELAKMGRVDYILDDGIEREELHYTLGENNIGVIDVKMDRGIIFTSELLGGITHTKPLEVIYESDEEMEAADAEDTEAAAATAEEKKKKRRRRSLTRRERNCRKQFVLDRERMCWVPKYYMIIGSGKNSRDKQLLDGAKRVRSLFKGARNKFSKRSKQNGSLVSCRGWCV
jgi:hypothetical protein